jgi:hypothetical protein
MEDTSLVPESELVPDGTCGTCIVEQSSTSF